MRPRAAASRLEHQIVRDRPAVAGKGPGDLELIFGAGCEVEHVGDVGECHQTFQLVIAVSAAAEHAQRQIDFGRSLFE